MEKILFKDYEIQTKVKQMANNITCDFYLFKQPVVVIGILKGAFMFTTDLVRYMNIHAIIDFVQIKSYKGTESSGIPDLIKDIDIDIKGKNIILVDGIIDSGSTLNFLIKYFESRGPLSINTAVLFNKECKRKIPVTINYFGWKIDDHFIVGYGMDYNELYRNIPYVKELIKK